MSFTQFEESKQNLELFFQFEANYISQFQF